MTIDPLLIERIYEAAVVPECWPAVLQAIADQAGAFGAVFFRNGRDDVAWLASSRFEQIAADYVAEGWSDDPAYAAPLLAEQFPGFRAETAYRSVEEIERLPIHAEFLAPRGLIAGAGTVLQGAGDNALQLTVEGFPTHGMAEAAVDWLDALRAPLGRAFSLTALLIAQHAAATVRAIDLAGVAAAVVSGDGRLRAANDRLALRLGDLLIDRPSGLRFADRFLQAQFADALLALSVGAGARSIAVAATDDRAACVIHLLPLTRGARDVFGWDGVLMLIAEAANASVPNADLLRLLFDLTPTEARLARHVIEGSTTAQAASQMNITGATARTHLRRVFAKTGVRRQAELMRLLLGLGGVH